MGGVQSVAVGVQSSRGLGDAHAVSFGSPRQRGGVAHVPAAPPRGSDLDSTPSALPVKASLPGSGGGKTTGSSRPDRSPPEQSSQQVSMEWSAGRTDRGAGVFQKSTAADDPRVAEPPWPPPFLDQQHPDHLLAARGSASHQHSSASEATPPLFEQISKLERPSSRPGSSHAGPKSRPRSSGTSTTGTSTTTGGKSAWGLPTSNLPHSVSTISGVSSVSPPEDSDGSTGTMEHTGIRHRPHSSVAPPRPPAPPNDDEDVVLDVLGDEEEGGHDTSVGGGGGALPRDSSKVDRVAMIEAASRALRERYYNFDSRPSDRSDRPESRKGSRNRGLTAGAEQTGSTTTQNTASPSENTEPGRGGNFTSENTEDPPKRMKRPPSRKKDPSASAATGLGGVAVGFKQYLRRQGSEELK